jgi:hypothetical protein
MEKGTYKFSEISGEKNFNEICCKNSNDFWEISFLPTIIEIFIEFFENIPNVIEGFVHKLCYLKIDKKSLKIGCSRRGGETQKTLVQN